MATPTRTALANVLASLTGVSAALILDRFTKISDAEFDGMISSIELAATPDQVFSAAAISKLAVDRADLYNAAEAVVYAATLDPDVVFTGAPGVAKLEAWATAAGWTAP